MKKLTVDQKARFYDEAIEKLGVILNLNTVKESGTISVDDIRKIFPELKESEDERVSKALIHLITEQDGYLTAVNGISTKDILAWLEKQRDKDKLIQELGEYKVKYTQEVLEKHINNMNNKDDERLRKTAIVFLKEFADKGYENAVECIDWLEKQGEQKPVIEGTFVNVDEVRDDFMQEVYRALYSDSTNDRANQIIDAFDHLPTITIQKPADKVEPKFKKD